MYLKKNMFMKELVKEELKKELLLVNVGNI